MNGSRITSAVVSPVPKSLWEQIHAADASATPFQSFAWLSGICANSKYADESRLYVTENNRIVVPLAVRRPFPGIAIAESLPHGFGTGGWISEKPISTSDMACVMQDLAQTNYGTIRIRSNPLHGRLLPAGDATGWSEITRRAHVLDLSGGFDTVWAKRIGGEKRNKIRKGIKAGLSFDIGNGPDFLADYYDVYMRWCLSRGRRQGVPPALQRILAARREPMWKYVNAAAAMGKSFMVCLARLDGRAVAGAILLMAETTAIYWRSASDPELSRRVAANDFLQKHMIERACQAGCRDYHMGESGEVASLEQFKESYGAKPYEYVEYAREVLPLTRLGFVIGTRFGQLSRAWRRQTASSS